jgi:Tol biopolymer transport system component
MNGYTLTPAQRRSARAMARLVTLTSIALLCLASGAQGAPGDTILVSVGEKSKNAGAASEIADHPVSANGRYVLITRRNGTQVLLRDLWRNSYETIDQGVVGSKIPQAITPDARYVVYARDAQVYLKDRQAGVTELISVNANGDPADEHSFRGAITPDGRFVVFSSFATNLAPPDPLGLDLYVRDRQNRTTERLGTSAPFTLDSTAYTSRIAISDNGRYVAFEAYGPAPLTESNVFVYDRQARRIERINLSPDGNPYVAMGWSSSPSLSANGRLVAYEANPIKFGQVDTHNSEVFVRDRVTGTVTRESFGRAPWIRGLAHHPSLSADGRYIAFHSWSWNLVPDDTNDRSDVFVRDRKTGKLERVSVTSDGTQATGPFQNSGSFDASLSRNGRWVVFGSRTTNLVPNDFNIVMDAFLHDRGPRTQ